MGTFCGGPKNKDYSILGSILGSSYFGKLSGDSLKKNFGSALSKPGDERELHHMSHSLNSLKGGYIRGYIGDYYRGH